MTETRLFAVSDLHVDHSENREWVAGLSTADYRNDVLLLAGDISDSLPLLRWCLDELSGRFSKVVFVPGNHDLWVVRDAQNVSSDHKLALLRRIAGDCGVAMNPVHFGPVSFVPLLSWYDDSFGSPDASLRESWLDYRACRWSEKVIDGDVCGHFLSMNEPALRISNQIIVTVSHFVPRLDLLDGKLTARSLYPVMGSTRLETQIRRLRPIIHVYGHSHCADSSRHEGITYVNRCLGYPRERRACVRALEPLLRFDPFSPSSCVRSEI